MTGTPTNPAYKCLTNADDFRILRFNNSILLIVTAALLIHGGFLWNRFRPRLVVNPSPDCGREFFLGSDADYLARLAQAAVDDHGNLPKKSVDAAPVLRAQAEKWGFKWPGQYKINGNGEVCDCNDQPFEISTADRLIVTSASSHTFYCAGLKGQ